MYIQRINRGFILVISFFILFAGLYTIVIAADMVPVIKKPIIDDVPTIFTDTVQLPAMIANTTLVAEQIVSYDGPYLEDGSEEYVSGVAALYLHNSGANMVTGCRIIVGLDYGLYRFEATCIPPGATVLVQEKDRKAYCDMGICSVVGSASTEGAAMLDSAEITLEYDLKGMLVRNVSEYDYDTIFIAHKNYAEDKNLYIGGVTYVTYVDCLQSGSEQYVWPVHMDENSRIVYICK